MLKATKYMYEINNFFFQKIILLFNCNLTHCLQSILPDDQKFLRVCLHVPVKQTTWLSVECTKLLTKLINGV